MNVIVFGATGTIGRPAVRALLDQGHTVTAFARAPERLDLRHDNLRLAAGDATNLSDVQGAMAGQDAALIVLGSGTSRKSTIRSVGTRTVIEAMQKAGVRRLVCQSTLGAHESWTNLNFFWKRIMFGFLIKPVFKDHEIQEDIVRESGLDWTIVRPSAFTDTPVAGPLKVGFGPSERDLSLKISRTEVAEFLASQVVATDAAGKTVAISH